MRLIASTATLIIGAASPCLARSAIVRVTHNDSDGLVLPGETTQFSLSISWQGALILHSIAGSVMATPNIGIASNNQVPNLLVQPGPVQVLNPGTPMGGSVSDVYILQGGLTWILFGQPPPFPWANNTGLTLLTFDWTAPQDLGRVEFDWIGSATLPDPWMVLNNQLLGFLPTTYLGTSLTVIPAPTPALVLAAGLAGVGAVRRRR